MRLLSGRDVQAGKIQRKLTVPRPASLCLEKRFGLRVDHNERLFFLSPVLSMSRWIGRSVASLRNRMSRSGSSISPTPRGGLVPPDRVVNRSVKEPNNHQLQVQLLPKV